MSAIDSIKRDIRKAKHECTLRLDLHGPDSMSYRMQAAKVRRLQDQLKEAKYDIARSRGLQVIGSAA